MNKKQFVEAIHALGISQLGAAVLFGTTTRSIQRYADGDQEVPKAYVVLLSVLRSCKISPYEATGLAGYNHDESDFTSTRGRKWPPPELTKLPKLQRKSASKKRR